MPLALALVGAAFPPERRGVGDGRAAGTHGPGGRERPGDRRRGRAGHRLAAGSSGSTCRSGSRRSRSCCARIPESTRPRPRARPARPRADHASRPLGIVWGLVRGNQRRLGQRRGRRLARRRRAAAGARSCAWEARARTPMLPLGLFRSRAFSAGNGAIFLTFASLFGAVFFLAQFLQTGLGYDAARRRAAAAAVDGDAVLRRAGGRRARRPLRRAPVPRRRAAAAGHRHGLDRARSPTRPWPTSRWSRRS